MPGGNDQSCDWPHSHARLLRTLFGKIAIPSCIAHRPRQKHRNAVCVKSGRVLCPSPLLCLASAGLVLLYGCVPGDVAVPAVEVHARGLSGSLRRRPVSLQVEPAVVERAQPQYSLTEITRSGCSDRYAW
jgi:hypothetical protein